MSGFIEWNVLISIFMCLNVFYVYFFIYLNVFYNYFNAFKCTLYLLFYI